MEAAGAVRERGLAEPTGATGQGSRRLSRAIPSSSIRSVRDARAIPASVGASHLGGGRRWADPFCHLERVEGEPRTQAANEFPTPVIRLSTSTMKARCGDRICRRQPLVWVDQLPERLVLSCRTVPERIKGSPSRKVEDGGRMRQSGDATGTNLMARNSSLRDFLAVLVRRRWILLQALVVVPAAAILVSVNQRPVYQASSKVLIGEAELGAALAEASKATAAPPDRIAATQAEVARLPEVARRTVIAAGDRGLTAGDFLKRSEVITNSNTDVLTFRVTAADPARAERLAAEYGRQFTQYRKAIVASTIASARNSIVSRMAQLTSDGFRRSHRYRALAAKARELETLEALAMSGGTALGIDGPAQKIQPRPVRNTVFGGIAGLILGIALAFLWETLDTRLTNLAPLADRLGIPVLGRIPRLPRKARKAGAPLLNRDPVHAEAFRTLRSNFGLANIAENARVVMVTSALPAEGKTTVASGLAAALARGGTRTVLVDFDVRRPSLARVFGLADAPTGIDVALGRATLEEALLPIRLGNGVLEDRDEGQALLRKGSLHVMALGSEPGEDIDSPGVQFFATVLDALRDRADVVLVDAPPLLGIGDAIALAPHVEGIVLVARRNYIRQADADELDRALARLPVRTLGLVLNCTEADTYALVRSYYARPSNTRAEREPSGRTGEQPAPRPVEPGGPDSA